MAYTTIDKPTDYFNTKLYTGNGTTDHAITGVNFKPDWVWIKKRSGVQYHSLYDSVRGADLLLQSQATDAEIDASGTGLLSFDSDGFTLGTDNGVNDNTDTFTSWNWLAGGTASSNTDGSITSTVSASTTSGFSIVSYTGTGANATVGHGLGTAPSMIIVKNRSIIENWEVYHQSLGNGTAIRLNINDASFSTSGRWNNTSPTSSVFSLGTATVVNGSGNNLIAYCFAEKKGFSKFGSYTGNGSADGTFVYTGFKPAWLMIKNTTTTATSWVIHDNKRDTFNIAKNNLDADNSDAEASLDRLDILSNGFKNKSTLGFNNNSGETYIYMAFAENPFVSSTGIPTTAR